MGQLNPKPIVTKNTVPGVAQFAGSELRWVSSSMQGWRMTMEDADVAAVHTVEVVGKKIDFGVFGVFDGHGGDRTARYVAENLCKALLSQMRNERGMIPNALQATYLTLEDDWKVEHNKLLDNGEFDDSGTTAVTALVTATHYFIANLGDSRLILVSDDKVRYQTVDQKPENPEESARITNAQGVIKDGRINGELGVSRSIGDFAFKQVPNLKRQAQLVSCDPVIQTQERMPTDQFLLIGCDGIWDVLKPHEAAKLILSKMREGYPMTKCAEYLLDYCLNQGSNDNLTCVLVALPGAPKELGTRPEVDYKGEFPHLQEEDKPTSTTDEDKPSDSGEIKLAKMRLKSDFKASDKLKATQEMLSDCNRGDEVIVEGTVDGVTGFVWAWSLKTRTRGMIPQMYLEPCTNPIAPILPLESEYAADAPRNAPTERPRMTTQESQRLDDQSGLAQEPKRNPGHRACPAFKVGERCRYGELCKLDHDPRPCPIWKRNANCFDQACTLRHLDEDRPKELCPEILDGGYCDGRCNKVHDIPPCEIHERGGACDHSCKKVHKRVTIRRGSHFNRGPFHVTVMRMCQQCSRKSESFVQCAKQHALCRACLFTKFESNAELCRLYAMQQSLPCQVDRCRATVGYDIIDKLLRPSEREALRAFGEAPRNRSRYNSSVDGYYAERNREMGGVPRAPPLDDRRNLAQVPLEDFEAVHASPRATLGSFITNFGATVTNSLKSWTGLASSGPDEPAGQKGLPIILPHCPNCKVSTCQIFQGKEALTTKDIFQICGYCRHQYCLLCNALLSRDAYGGHIRKHLGTKPDIDVRQAFLYKSLDARIALHRSYLSALSAGLYMKDLSSIVSQLESDIRMMNLWPCAVGFEFEMELWIQKLDPCKNITLLQIEYLFQKWLERNGENQRLKEAATRNIEIIAAQLLGCKVEPIKSLDPATTY